MPGFSNVLDPTADAISSDQSIVVEFVRNFIPPDENPAEPISTILYPITERFNQRLRRDCHGEQDGRRRNQQDDDDDVVVGSLSITLFWRDLLRNTVPPSSRGILVVTSNTCGQTFTYEIDGAETTYLADRDVRDTQYDGMSVTATLSSMLIQSPASSAFFHRCTDFSSLDSTCPVTIRISPSPKNQQDFISNDPVIFAVGSWLIFFFAGGLFLLYDFLVDRRGRPS